ncbi:carboxypeptidase regulatory-like domain-containing protein [Pseudonocardia saturnea]
MITLPVVLIAVAVLLLLALLLGLFLQRRRTAGATLPGPRTVADLVQQRADRDPAPAPAEPVEPGVEEPADDTPADVVASTVDEPVAAVGADTEPVDVEEPRVPVPGPAPVTAARAVAPLGDDVPWRRAAQMSGGAEAEADPGPEPEPSEAGRVPALALLRRPSRRPLPADTRHPFLSSASRPAAVPAAPPAEVAEAAAPGPVEETAAEEAAVEETAVEPAGAEPTAVVPTVVEPIGAVPAGAEPAAVESTGSELAGADLTIAESSDAEPNSAEPTGIEPADADAVAAEEVAAEPLGVEPVGVEPVGVEPVGVEPVGADPVDLEPSAEPTDTGSGPAEPIVVEQPGAAQPEADEARDESTAVVPTHPQPSADEPAGRDEAEGVPSAVLPLVGTGLAAGAIVEVGARIAAGRTDDHDAARSGPAAGPVEESDVVHTREMDVRVVTDRPDHSRVDLVPVDGPPEVDGALASPAADQADDVREPADHSDIAPHPEPDDFPSTDPDVLFDSPPEAPAADEPAPDDVTGAPAAEEPADDTPAPGASATEAVAASDVPAGPRESPPAPDDVAAVAPPVEAPRTWTAETPAPEVAAEPAESTTAQPRPTGPARRSPRDPAHLAAEQAAADLALLRTFGDPSARPERAPIVALEGTTRPESPRPVGAAQPVRFRAVRRDGTQVAGAAVALLDDRGHEVGTGRSATGELTAPHPGAYVLVATAPDHQPGAVALTVGDAPVDADVLLVRSAALVGVVIGEDGPLAGARVTLVQDGEVVDVAETDADGAYLVADLASGEYAVSVAAAGCEADVVLVVVADETECVHDVELEPAGVPAG